MTMKTQSDFARVAVDPLGGAAPQTPRDTYRPVIGGCRWTF